MSVLSKCNELAINFTFVSSLAVSSRLFVEYIKVEDYKFSLTTESASF